MDPNFDLRRDEVAGWSRLDVIDRGGAPSLCDHTPLFDYLLRESEVGNGGERFGPVGSAILMEVFGGMLAYCDTSFLTSEPDWNPDPCVSKERWTGLWHEGDQEAFSRTALIESDDDYPFDLADVVRIRGDGRLLDPVFALGLATVVMGICIAMFATLQTQMNARLDQAPVWFGLQFAAVTIARPNQAIARTQARR